jgi:glycosyltransferase involved in cell wall biosynthesis
VKVLLSNPSKQYSHHTAKALHLAQKNFVFITSYWYQPNRLFEKLALIIIPSFKKNFLKKYSPELYRFLVKDHFKGIIFSFFGRFFYAIEKRSYKEDCIHDNYVKKIIQKKQPVLIIGYEKSCLKSFQTAKAYGAITILDLAQVHVSFIEDLRNKYTFYKNITGSKKLFEKIKGLKLKEYELADTILVLSEFAKQTMLSNGIPENKLRLVNLGYSPKQFIPKQQYPSTNEVLQLVFIGTVSYRKGIHLLLNFIQSTTLNIHLTIAGSLGDGISKEMLHCSKVSYLSFLQHNEIVKLLHQSDVFVFPSFLDSWAMVVIEAMACGLPVIVTENTGAKEAINNDCGFIIPVNDAIMLEEKINFFYNNREQVRIMGQAAAVQAKKYTWQQYYNQINDVVDELAKTNHLNLS